MHGNPEWLPAIRRVVGEGLHFHGIRASGSRVSKQVAIRRRVTRDGGGRRTKRKLATGGAGASADGGRGQESRKQKKIRAADSTTVERCSIGRDTNGN